ncbi:MAG: NAD kinase [Bacteroidetes bacterium]|nr:MAG: NAD kinase [Bacteroidota bacterium]
MQVAVFSRQLKEPDLPQVKRLLRSLQERGIATYLYKPFLELFREKTGEGTNLGHFESYLDFRARKFDFLITLGGDGTILTAITLVKDSGVPILGINLGRLGFLASVEQSLIEHAVALLHQGHYSLDVRTTLWLESNLPLFGEDRFALNDFTILKRDTSSMITIDTYINGAYLNTYWADGIIVATPTGSTGYSLSCGGPIIFPSSGNFVITPVAPHNLNVRPIVISDDSVVSFQVRGRTETFLCTLDSRFEPITAEHQLAVRKGDFQIRLVRLRDIGFLETIRNKLAWGVDTRNE